MSVDWDKLKGTPVNIDAEPTKAEENKIVKKLETFANKNIDRKVVDESNNFSVYGFLKVNGHLESLRLDSRKAKIWLLYQYKKTSGEIVSPEQCDHALSSIQASAYFETTERAQIYNRIAMVNDVLYYDLTWDDWKVIKIDKNDWEIIDTQIDTPVFERRQHQAPQVYPSKSDFNGLEKLCYWLRIKDEDKFIFKVHLVSLFIEKYPMPVMVFSGEQGSIKSTLTRTIKHIVDPSSQELQKITDKNDDLALMIYNRYLTAFDNVTKFDQDLSDELCRVITGMGVSKRQLYTDQDEIILIMKRKLVLNGIAPSLDFPDFRDRCIFYETARIDENMRITEEEFNSIIADIMPQLLGQIFTILSGAIKFYDKAKQELKGKMQRMSDFSVWGEAISQSMKCRPGEFIQAYTNRLIKEKLDVVSSYPMFLLIQDMVDIPCKEIEHLLDENDNCVNCNNTLKPYTASMSEFYKKITDDATQKGINTRTKYAHFPQAAHTVRHHLISLQPVFRALGIDFEFKKVTTTSTEYKKGATLITISKKYRKIGSLDSTASPKGKSVPKSGEPSEKNSLTESVTRLTDSEPENPSEPISPTKLPDANDVKRFFNDS